MKANFTSLVDVLQNCLETRFKPKQVTRINHLSPAKLRPLAQLVEAFYKSYKFPQKGLHELRPYFTGKWVGEPEFGRDLVFNPSHYRTGEYVHVPGESGRMLREAKKRLLYCHSITFIDPLPYLLDYFRLAPFGDEARARLPPIKELLVEYAHLAPLIETGVILPVSSPIEGGAIDTKDIQVLTEEQTVQLTAALAQYDPELVELISSVILEEQMRLRKLEHQVDQVLPDGRSVDVLRQLLFVTQQRFASRDVIEPFQVSLLGSIPSIDPDAVTAADIIRMRTDEDLFAEWRALIGRVLKRLYEKQDQFSDLDREFAHVVRDEVQLWNAKLAERKRKSSFTSQLISSIDRVAVGAISGAVGGAITGLAVAGPPGTLLGGAIGGTIGGVSQPALESIRDMARALVNRPGAVSLRHHFLALGIEELMMCLRFPQPNHALQRKSPPLSAGVGRQ